jgi:hypothetical protein
MATKTNDWITSGIRTSCKHKRELSLACKNNPELRNYYKNYCKTLSTVIKEAKRLKYESKNKKSNNQNKTIWDIVKMETGKINTQENDNIDALKFEGKIVNDYKETADTLNKHFISVAENIVTKNNHNDSSINSMYKTTPIHYLLQSLSVPFQTLNLSYYQLGKLRILLKPSKQKTPMVMTDYLPNY